MIFYDLAAPERCNPTGKAIKKKNWQIAFLFFFKGLFGRSRIYNDYIGHKKGNKTRYDKEVFDYINRLNIFSIIKISFLNHEHKFHTGESMNEV